MGKDVIQFAFSEAVCVQSEYSKGAVEVGKVLLIASCDI